MAKTKYQSDFPERVEKMAREGMIEADMQYNLGISHNAFNNYKNKYGEFSDALKRGKSIVDDKVESALLKRALGYNYEETRVEYTPEGEGKQGEIERVIKTQKDMAPDVTAQIFWLKNRKKDEWRDRKDVSVKIFKLTIEERVDRIYQLLERAGNGRTRSLPPADPVDPE